MLQSCDADDELRWTIYSHVAWSGVFASVTKVNSEDLED